MVTRLVTINFSGSVPRDEIINYNLHTLAFFHLAKELQCITAVNNSLHTYMLQSRSVAFLPQVLFLRKRSTHYKTLQIVTYNN